MRVASLLPGATEMVHALGAGDALVGVSHVCDHPPGVGELPALVRSALPTGGSSEEIDRRVRELREAGEPLHEVAVDRLRELRPDVVVTQSLCEVCAANAPDVEAAVEAAGLDARVVDLRGTRLADVLDDIEHLGRVLEREEEARRVVAALRARLGAVRDEVGDADPVPLVALEWLAPPMRTGHWIPDQIEAAGGRPLLGEHGDHSVPITWEAVQDAAPEALVVLACGLSPDQAADELASPPHGPVARTPAWRAGRVTALDGDAHFSRAGPRLVDGVEALAHVLHPDRAPDRWPEGSRRVEAGAVARGPA